MFNNIYFFENLNCYEKIWKNVAVVEKIKTDPLFFFFENRNFYENIWKNVAEPDRPQMTI